MSDFTTQSAGIEHIEVLIRHRSEIFREMGFSAEEIEPVVAAARSYLKAALPKGNACRAWLALLDEKIIGGGFLVIADWPGVPRCSGAQYPWILNVYVEPEFRHRGVAGLLMHQMIQFCREAGYPFVALHASEQGRPLYEKLGFKQTSEMRLSLQPRPAK